MGIVPEILTLRGKTWQTFWRSTGVLEEKGTRPCCSRGRWNSLLYRELDFEGDVLKHPEYLEAAHTAGKQFFRALGSHDPG